jgi:hypothetical protein
MNKTEIKNRLDEIAKQADNLFNEANRLQEELAKPESKVWKPEHSEKYWIISINGHLSELMWDNYQQDEEMYTIGNCYQTQAEAEFYRDNQITLTKIRRYAKEHNVCDTQDAVILFDSDVGGVCSTHRKDERTTIPMFDKYTIALSAIKEIGEDNIKKLFFEYNEWVEYNER